MVTEKERQEIVDAEQLRLLPVFFWVLAAFDLFLSIYGFFYAGTGLFMALVPWEENAVDAPPAFMGWFFFALGLAFILWFVGLGVFKILAGVWIRKRTHRIAILIAAGISCFSWPFGVVVAVFAFIVLLRPSVAEMFESSQQPVAAAVATQPGEAEASDSL